MIGAVIIFIAGWTIRRIWPTGVLFLTVFAAISVGLGLITRNQGREALGEPPIPLTFEVIGFGYASTLAIHTFIFLVAFGLSKLLSKKRSEPKQTESSGALDD